MKMPDRDTWIIWYTLIAFGVLASIVLAEFAEIRFLHSIWFTVPAFFASGNLLFNWWMRSIDKRIEKETTPIETKEVPELGIVKRLPGRWEIDLELKLHGEEAFSIPVSFEAESVGPSGRQVRLAKEFASKYSENRHEYLSQLKDYFASNGVPDDFGTVLVNDLSFHINPDGEPEDIEICFETEGRYSDMGYYLVLKDWNVVNVYGED